MLLHTNNNNTKWEKIQQSSVNLKTEMGKDGEYVTLLPITQTSGETI